MVPLTTLRLGGVMVILIAALAAPAVAQVRDSQLVEWSYHFAETPQGLGALQLYLNYGARQRIELNLSVWSQTSTPVKVSQERLRAALSFRMFTGGAEIPTVVSWEPRINHDTSPSVPTDLVSDVPLPPQAQLIFWLTVQRADGLPFAPAEYTVMIRMPGLQSALSTSDGAPWRGRTPVHTGTVTLAIIEPTTPTEISTMHYLTGENFYFRRRSPADAVSHFELAVQADPSNVAAQRVLGNTYMTLGSYGLAVITYENMLKLPLARTRENLRALALAYVADRDEARATRILQETGLPSTEIVPALARMRETVKELDDAHAQAEK